MSRKIFAVGDIHGSFEKLEALMKILPWRKDSDDLSSSSEITWIAVPMRARWSSIW